MNTKLVTSTSLTRAVSYLSVCLVIFAPLNILAAEGQSSDSNWSHDSFRPFSAYEVRTTSPLLRIAAYGTFVAGARAGEMTGSVSTAERTVDFQFDRGNIVTGDHYSLGTRLLRNDEGVAIVEMVAKSPSGERATALLRLDKRALTVENTGLRDIRGLLDRSHDFRLLRSTVPAFDSPSPSMSGRHHAVVKDACLTAAVGAGTAILIMLVVCDEGDLGDCLGALGALATALMSMYDSCGPPDLCGGSCPTVPEPPCTSKTIC